MKVEKLIQTLGAEFYTGVPDSQLRPLCDYLMHTFGIDPKHHLIAANEGNAAALAAGYHLATGKVPVVYMQNSGEGNIINPAASLLNDKVYAIPVIFVIGWRGEPGIHDEPQHIYQGEVTVKLLDDMDIASFVIGKDTTEQELETAMERFQDVLAQGKDVAFVIRKGALTYDTKVEYRNDNDMVREEIIRHIAAVTGEDPIVSTTGKASRELFEIRERRHETHAHDFLTVGSMGHASSIALGLALTHPEKRVFCIDGDGALLMHMGAMVTLAHVHPDRFVLVLINNGSHDTVGGMPTAIESVQVPQLARNLKFDHVLSCSDPQSLHQAMQELCAAEGLCLLEIHCAGGARSDLGRPTVSPQENMHAFMAALEAP